VDAGGVRDNAVEVKQDGIVLYAADRWFAPRLLH
jgi:hypothetical protein